MKCHTNEYRQNYPCQLKLNVLVKTRHMFSLAYACVYAHACVKYGILHVRMSLSLCRQCSHLLMLHACLMNILACAYYYLYVQVKTSLKQVLCRLMLKLMLQF